MDPIKQRDRYPKAKIEEPNLRLPKAMLKPNSADSNDDLCYMQIFEDDTHRAQHLAEAIAAGAKLDRKVYRIRNKELAKFILKDFGGMSEIHRASKATIGLLVDSEANLHRHAYLDLMGTVEEVSTAEGLILDNILKTYSTLAYPVILMPPIIYEDYIIIPEHKVTNILGTYGTNILRMEMESGAWIKIEPGAPPGGSNQEKLTRVFGPRDQVIKAINLIKAVTYEPAAQEELWREFNEPCWRDFFERKEAEEAKLKEYSGEPEKEKHGSGVTEEEKQESRCKEAVEGESEEKKKPKKLIIKLKKPGGGGTQDQSEGSKQTEGSLRGTYLRKKSRSEGSKKIEGGGEFKVPKWSETFGHMKKTEEEGKQQQAEEGGGSGVTEKEKQREHVEQEGEGGEPKEKRQEDVEEVESQDLEAKLKEYSGEAEKGKQQEQAEEGGSGESRSKEAVEGEQVKEKKPKKLIIRLRKKSKEKREEDVEEGRKDKESGESE